MKIIVDANIVFSAILNTNGKIGSLLIKPPKNLSFIAPNFLRVEIKKHYLKLSKISGLTLEQIQEAEFQIYKNINFISEEQIKTETWLIAEKLVANIDPKDIQYIAFAKQFKCKIWSGDKMLIKGLEKKQFTNFVSTEDLFNYQKK
jgi:predicted nucleic acid-binding protein